MCASGVAGGGSGDVPRSWSRRRLSLLTGVVFLAGWQEEQALAAGDVRGPDQILGAPRYGEKRVERYARSIGCSRYITRTIPIYYRLARGGT